MNQTRSEPNGSLAMSFTSLGKRKSLRGISDFPEDIPQIDDEIERLERKRDSGKFVYLASKRVSLGGITELSTSELVAQYANCMRLSAENKINHKNAFNLPLIDCMKMLLQNKDEQMENFQVVGCTLDASAKIYASRVDRVHMDGMTFAKGLGGRSKNSVPSQKEAIDGEEVPDDDPGPGKRKRTKKKHKLSRDVSKINKNVDNVVKDPTFVVLRQQFSNCQPSFISFIPKLKLDGDDCKISMDMDEPCLPEDTESCYEDDCVPFECNTDGNADLVPLPYKEILGKDCNDLEYDTLLSASMLDDSFDIATDDHHMDELENDHINEDDAILEGYSAVKDASTWKEQSQVELEAARAGCTARIGPREKVVDVQEAILKHVKEGGNIDYLYTNLDRMLCAGPSHWQSLSKLRDKNSALPNRQKNRKKKILIVDFSNATNINLLISRCTTLTRSYIENNWTTNKVTIPPDLHIDISILTRYFTRKRCGFKIGSTQNKPDIPPDEDLNDYDYDNLNDSQHCPAASPGPGSDGDCSTDKELPAFVEELEPAVDVHTYDPASGDAWSMVDPPAKVARIHVPYAQHAKKVDMKVLKNVIWKVLSEDSYNKEVGKSDITPRKRSKNAKNKHDIHSTQLTAMTKQIIFSEMERKVMKIVPHEMAQELTMPLVFTALLHLANERVLRLTEHDDHSDIIIEQDQGAESFVKKLQERQFM